MTLVPLFQGTSPAFWFVRYGMEKLVKNWEQGMTLVQYICNLNHFIAYSMVVTMFITCAYGRPCGCGVCVVCVCVVCVCGVCVWCVCV